MEKRYTLKQIIDRIHKEILGTPIYGFEEEKLWGDDFRNKYFSREGEIAGEKYSSRVNQVLSGAAMSHTLDEVRKRLNKLYQLEG